MTLISQSRIERNLKVILDFVPNHSSDEHPLVYRITQLQGQPQARLVHLAATPKPDGSPPNNWRSVNGLGDSRLRSGPGTNLQRSNST